MTDKDKLAKVRAEIERLIDRKDPNTYLGVLKIEAYKDVLSIIDSMQEEPVSDLEEAATSFARKDSEGISNPANFYYTVADKARIFKAGANWKEQQFKKNRLKHCNGITNEQAELEQGFIDQHLDKYQRMPTFLDAIEYGMKLKEQQMVAKAVDALVHTFDNGYIRVGTQLLANNEYGLNVGDKVKVIIIKED